jgi:hypothetical protein
MQGMRKGLAILAVVIGLAMMQIPMVVECWPQLRPLVLEGKPIGGLRWEPGMTWLYWSAAGGVLLVGGVAVLAWPKKGKTIGCQ